MTQQEFFERYSFDTKTDQLGEGGFGEVFKAFDTHLDKWVAIKQCKVKKGLERFSLQKEVDLATKLPTHPNIAHYESCHRFDIPMAGTFDFGVLQYYADGNLSQLHKSEELTENEISEILVGILNGLSHLHKHNVIHRDIKPSNILISKRGDKYIPKITDFGISKEHSNVMQTAFTNSLIGGTLDYASPEQLKGDNKIKENTDLWSFGVMTYQLLTNKLPFNSNIKSNNELARNKTTSNILSGILPSDINTINSPFQELINKCLIVDIFRRVQYTDELIKYIKDHKSLTSTKSFHLIGVMMNGKSGYIDLQGNVIIETKYDYIEPCKLYGLFLVIINNKYGFIDINENIIIPIIYEWALTFEDEITAVKLNGKCGCIDKNGNIIVPYIYEGILAFSEGIAPFLEKNDHSLDFEDALYSGNYKGYRYGYINNKGSVVHPVNYRFRGLNYFTIAKFRNGCVVVSLDDKYCILDKNFEPLIPFIYSGIIQNESGKSKANDPKFILTDANRKKGYFNQHTNTVIPTQYDSCEHFEDGIARTKKTPQNSWGCIDANGKIIVPHIYKKIESFINDLAIVNLDDKYGIIDKSGNIVIPTKYYKTYPFSEDLAAVCVEYHQIGPLYGGRWQNFTKTIEKWGFVNKRNEMIIPATYHKVLSFSEGLASVLIEKGGWNENNTIYTADQWGYINHKNEVIIPEFFKEALSFSEGRAAVLIKDEWKYINTKGEFILPEKYKQLSKYSYTNGIISAYNEDINKWELLDKNGKNILGNIAFPPDLYPPKNYDSKAYFFEHLSHSHRLIKVMCLKNSAEDQDLWDIYNINGEKITKSPYESIYCFVEEIFLQNKE